MSKYTPQKRLLELKNNDLSIKKQKLYCTVCDLELDHERKWMIDSHLKTKKHISNSNPKESQRSLDFTTENSKDLFKRDLIIGFGSANIPLHKLNNKNFKNIFNKYLKSDYKIPSVSSMRNNLPKIYEEEMKNMISFFNDSKIALMCDETSDSLNRSVFQIIFIKLDLNVYNKPKLVDTVFLDDVNFETVSRALVDCLVKMEVKFQNVMAFISDNASYMIKAFKSCLKTLLYNCTHVTCFAHIVNLVGETWRSNLNEIDGIVANLKSIFARGANRKKRLIDFLKTKGVENPKLYPSPVVTRWNTWFNAVKYINENFANLSLFIDSECEEDETVALCKLKRLFKTCNLKEQFEFVASKCDNFKFVLLKFENQDFNTTNVYSVIFDLYFWLESQLEIYQNSETFQHDFGKKLFSDAKSKLGKYLLDGAQPATELFKNARVFDPLQACYLSRKLDDFSFPEFIKSQIKDEWLLYLEISSELNKQSLDNFELEKWWLSHKTRLTKMFEVARWYIKIPSSSCDSERALSKYKIILDDTRQNMTESTIKINNFFYFNFTNDFFDESRDSESGEEDIIPL